MKKLLNIIFALVLLATLPLEARYRYNPYTGKLDYYESAADATLGGIGDVTLTAPATGDLLSYSGAVWVNLNVGSNGEFLSVVLGQPAWVPAPAGVSTFSGLTDTPANYTGKASQLVQVNAGATALEFFAGSPAGTVIVADGAGGWTKDENLLITAGKISTGGYEGTPIANAYIAGINQNLLTTSSPAFDNLTIDKIAASETIYHTAMQTATGDGTTTVDWALGNLFYFTFGAANETFTFTAPAGPARILLVLEQDGVGSRTATWPGTVLWPGGVAPTLSTAAAEVDIVAFLYDGTNYFGLFNGNFE